MFNYFSSTFSYLSIFDLDSLCNHLSNFSSAKVPDKAKVIAEVGAGAFSFWLVRGLTRHNMKRVLEASDKLNRNVKEKTVGNTDVNTNTKGKEGSIPLSCSVLTVSSNLGCRLVSNKTS